jgi:hypothetical protein
MVSPSGSPVACQRASILGGMKPADLPVLQPAKINVNAAQAISPTLSQSLLLGAHEVIE